MLSQKDQQFSIKNNCLFKLSQVNKAYYNQTCIKRSPLGQRKSGFI